MTASWYFGSFFIYDCCHRKDDLIGVWWYNDTGVQSLIYLVLLANRLLMVAVGVSVSLRDLFSFE